MNSPSNPAMKEVFSTLRLLVDDLAINSSVASLLFPDGKPHSFESELWDYKERLPTILPGSDEEQKKSYKIEIGNLIKDAASFHNMYGGYLVFGVKNQGSERIIGCTDILDIGTFNSQLASYTDRNIECLFELLNIPIASHSRQVGLMLIPRRPSNMLPVKFKKKGPDKLNGGRCFNDETYIRIRDACRPAADSASDWAMLLSERSPPGKALPASKRKVSFSLPARDPDLIEFVGRDTDLAALRNWLNDPRSPIRLITGIGGLGKTALAYRFAEEVITLGAGDIEWVIWVTAKLRTYSGLRGEVISSPAADYHDLSSLFKAILKAISYELPSEHEDEPLADEYADRLAEALQIYTCLIVVDDIDSLSPEEQRELVAVLSGVMLRTFGQAQTPSRLLLTSRIDQALPLTWVLKISGLDKDAFNRHVNNLCDTFGIGEIKEANRDKIREMTSASPLFAASVIRLIRLGENLSNVLETWRGQDGEEVRRFAFEREIKRLSPGQGRLLYAVLLLQETTTNDIAGILDITAKIVRDRIGELQSYHLIATAIGSSGDTTVFPPTDLLSVADILRAHLGTHAASVERACQLARERSIVDSRTIGLVVRRILAAWDEKRYEDAISIAREMRKRYPKNGDLASLLGAALMRMSSPDYSEIVTELEAARKLGCTRQELLKNLIYVKKELENWSELYELTRGLSSSDSADDPALKGFISACRGLIARAKVRGDHSRRAALSMEVVEKISLKFRKTRLDPQLFAQLTAIRFDFAREYINALASANRRLGDRIIIFEGVARLAELDVLRYELIRVGLDALNTWWSDVERRPIVEIATSSLLSKQLRRLDIIHDRLEVIGVRTEVLTAVSSTRRDLAHRGAKFVT